MSFQPEPVTEEEYNQALRDAVNEYYEHALNDPTMSQEEALTTTGEMSENYLNAVDEFREEASMAEEAEIEVECDDVSSSISDDLISDVGIDDIGIDDVGIDDDGIDDGIDGGMEI